MKKICLIVAGILFLFWISGAVADQLVYKPVNPSFGGSPLNGQWLLNSAQMQDPHGFLTKKVEPAPAKSQLEIFKEQLLNKILYGMSNAATKQMYDAEGNLKMGHYTIGSYDINVEEVLEGISVSITDTQTLNTTIIEIPNIIY